MSIEPNKSLMKDKMNRALTQSMFYEFEYSREDFVQFTLDDEDKVVDGKTLISLKKLYLEEEDVTEYIFATKYLIGWKHWNKLNGNKFLREHFDEWREELAMKLEGHAIQKIMDSAYEDENFAAQKWLAERGWTKRKAGRPSKEEIKGHLKNQERVFDEYAEDEKRLRVIK
jgi:hypothetical protein